MSQTLDYQKDEAVRPALDSARRAAPGVKVLVAIALLAIGVYANSVVNGFALDDTGIVENNPAVLNLEWAEIWSSNYWPSPEGMPDLLYRPLTVWTYLVNQAIAPGVTWPFHAVNIALHAVVSVLVAALAWRFARRRAVAVLTGVLFAVHPIHTEVVANTVGRAELLAAMWSAAALLLFLPRESLLAGPPEKRGLWHGWLVAACFLLACLSKETPLVLLGGVVFLDIWRWSHWTATARPRLRTWLLSQAWRYYLPMGVAAGAYMAMRIHAVGLMAAASSCHPIVNPLVDPTVTIGQRIVTPFALLAKYVTLTFWPGTLSSDYSYPSILPTANILQSQALMGLMVVLGGCVVVFGQWRKWPTAVALVVMLACSYVLVANVIRIGTIFGERLFYWPSAFALMLVSMAMIRGWDAVAALPTRATLRWVGGAGAAAACVAMSVRTIARNVDWKDNVHLAISTARDNPASAKACFWAGAVLLTQTDKPEWERVGLNLIKMAVEEREDYGMPQWEMAKYHQRRGEFGESFVWLCRAARWRGGSYEVRMSLQAIKDELKRRPESDYMPAVEAYLAERPDDASAYLAKGLALAAQNKLAEADEALTAAVLTDRKFLEGSAELGLLKQRRGDFETAIVMLRGYNMVVRQNPEARIELARAFMELDWEKHPGAMREAEYNLNRASTMYFAGPQVREARTAFERRKAKFTERTRLRAAGDARADAGSAIEAIP